MVVRKAGKNKNNFLINKIGSKLNIEMKNQFRYFSVSDIFHFDSLRVVQASLSYTGSEVTDYIYQKARQIV